MHQSKFLWAGLFGLLSLFISSQLFAQADVIEKRQKLMKSNAAAAKAIKGAAEEKDYAAVETKAKEIMGNAEKIPDLFPKGSTKGKTKAKGEIWDKWDEFSKNPGKLRKAANELAGAAAAKDDDKVKAGIKALSGTCKGCHESFRAEKYSE
ncbi:MAG: c-type cytochrome [Candidatus Binatia bacterium]